MAMDPVNKKALKKDFDDRADKDIDNDGDTDSTDKYLHKRRQAVSKAISKMKESVAVFESHFKVGDKVEYEAPDGGEYYGTIIKTDKPEEGAYYHVKLENGKVVKAKPEQLESEEDEDEDDDDDKEDMDEAKTASQHRMAMVNKIKKSGVVKSGSMKKEEVKLVDDIEQIDEISKDLAGRYLKKAVISTADAGRDSADHRKNIRDRGIRKFVNRRMGTSDAVRKLTGKARVPATEETQIDEGNMMSAAKELEMYARKSGGIDKGDFMKAVVMMKKGQKKQLGKFVDELDTEPREKILSVMDKHLREETQIEEKYRPATPEEIRKDKERERKAQRAAGSKRSSMTTKSINKNLYGKMRGGLKTEEYVNEKLSVADGMGAWIDDFKKSDAPQFKGKDEKERREMAIAAYLAAKRNAKK